MIGQQSKAERLLFVNLPAQGFPAVYEVSFLYYKPSRR